MLPLQEAWVRGPPLKNLYQVLRGGSSYSQFLMREHSTRILPRRGGFLSINLCAIDWSVNHFSAIHLSANHSRMAHHERGSWIALAAAQIKNATHYNALQHVATRCNTLQHASQHCNTLKHTVTRCDTMQHTATPCNTLQHIATYCSTLQRTLSAALQIVWNACGWIMSHIWMKSVTEMISYI